MAFGKRARGAGGSMAAYPVLSARTEPSSDPSDRMTEDLCAERARSPTTATVRSSGEPQARTLDSVASAPPSRAYRGAAAAGRSANVHLCGACGRCAPETRKSRGGSCSPRAAVDDWQGWRVHARRAAKRPAGRAVADAAATRVLLKKEGRAAFSAVQCGLQVGRRCGSGTACYI